MPIRWVELLTRSVTPRCRSNSSRANLLVSARVVRSAMRRVPRMTVRYSDKTRPRCRNYYIMTSVRLLCDTLGRSHIRDPSSASRQAEFAGPSHSCEASAMAWTADSSASPSAGGGIELFRMTSIVLSLPLLLDLLNWQGRESMNYGFGWCGLRKGQVGNESWRSCKISRLASIPACFQRHSVRQR